MNETQCREIVKARSRGVCEWCMRQPATNMAHRKPKGQGGRWEPANILHLCGFGNHNDGSCHGWVENNAQDAHRVGLRLWRSEDPLVVPVVFRSGASCLLSNDGRRLIP